MLITNEEMSKYSLRTDVREESIVGIRDELYRDKTI